MSGHSKWAKVKHKKAKDDAIRGRIFTRLIREITVAARHGGDPNNNPRLRTAIEGARSYNMPQDNIDRAIKRGTGELEGSTFEEVSYEGYGPGGVAILIEAITDNRNRTTSELRHLFSRLGGNLASAGSVAWQFTTRGIIAIDGTKFDEDTVIGLGLDGGAVDVSKEDSTITVVTNAEDFKKMKDLLSQNKIEVMRSEVTRVPQNTVPVSEREAEKVLKLYEALDEHDDVQHVYANFDIPDEIMEKFSA
jgi:YebC/PmpR family DNA-binding regulatory protein